MRRVLWPLLSLLMAPLPTVDAAAAAAAAASGGGGGSGGGGSGEGDESPEQQRAAAVRALASFARKDVLRPSGLCPPWHDDGDNGSDCEGEDGDGAGRLHTEREEDQAGMAAGQGGDGAPRTNPALDRRAPTKQQQRRVGGGGGDVGYVRRGTAAISGALGYFSSASPTDAQASPAAAAPGAEEALQRGASSGGAAAAAAAAAAVSDVSLIEEGGGNPNPDPGPPSGTTVISVASPTRCSRASGEEAVLGGGGGGSPGGERKGLLTRVVPVDEPWQSIYLWSLLFVKTTTDLRLFDSRAVRLFDIIEGESEDGSADEGAGSHYGEHDGDAGSEVDEEYYRESIFPPEDSHSEAEEGEPAGFLHGGGGDSSSVVAAAESFQEGDGRADSLV